MSSNRIQHPVIATRRYEDRYDSRRDSVKYVVTAIIVLLAVSAIALTASCTQDEPLVDRQTIEGYAVRDNASWIPGSKAVLGTTFPHESFGLFAAKYSGGWNGTACPDYMFNLPVSEQDGVWSTATTYYWLNGMNMRFFAYAPYQSEAATEGISSFPVATEAGAPVVTYTLPARIADQKDFVVASTEDLEDLPGDGVIPLTFTHALSFIEISAKTTSSVSYDVSDIKIGVTSHPSRDLSLLDCTWQAPKSGQAAVEALYELPDITVGDVPVRFTGSEWIAAIPKDDNSATLTISVSYNSSTYSASIQNMPLSKGTTYTIAAELSVSSVKMTISECNAGTFYLLGSFTISGTTPGSFNHVATYTIDQTTSGNFYGYDPFAPTSSTPGNFTRIDK